MGQNLGSSVRAGLMSAKAGTAIAPVSATPYAVLHTDRNLWATTPASGDGDIQLPPAEEMIGIILAVEVIIDGTGTVTVHSLDSDGAYAALGSALTAIGAHTIVYSNGISWRVLAESAT